MKVCKVENCAKPIHAMGLCAMHRWRLKKYGSFELPEKDNKPVTEQKCCRCKIIKPLSDFHKQNSRKIGVTARCKKCAIQVAKEWHDNNIERYNANSRKNHKKKTPEQKRKDCERSLRYAKRNPEKIKEKQRLYREKNPEIKRSSEAKRKAKKLENGVFLILKKELKILYSSPCYFCGSKDKIHADHIIPLSRGGRHSIGNLQPLCASCNISKNNKFIVEYKKGKSFLDEFVAPEVAEVE
jgi:5-methylcytosine-specific restriction endonuclease McrA